jgi:Peptidase family M23
MNLNILIGACVVSAISAFAQESGIGIRATVYPTPSYIENLERGQSVATDFGIENKTAEKLTLKSITVSVFDHSGQLAFRKALNDERQNTLYAPDRVVPASKTLQMSNPLDLFDKHLVLGKLRYDFIFSTEDRKRDYSDFVEFAPVAYRQKAKLNLPLKGRIYIWDGHDLYSHHRYFSFLTSPLHELGFRTNFERYGYDFVFVNENGDMYQGDPKQNQSWFGFGKPVYATADGVIADSYDGVPDNRSFNEKELATREMAFGGNYVMLDHGNREISYFGHLKQGSIRVRKGDKVKRGEAIAQVGASGSSLFPHLHYQLQNNLGAKTAEGLPHWFSRFERVIGSRSLRVKRGAIDTGEILESR